MRVGKEKKRENVTQFDLNTSISEKGIVPIYSREYVAHRWFWMPCKLCKLCILFVYREYMREECLA